MPSQSLHIVGRTLKQFIKTQLNKLPYIKTLYELSKQQGMYPAGHYHSPIPSSDDILRNRKFRESTGPELPDIELNQASQFERLQTYQRYYTELPFPEKPGAEFRYYYDQPWFCYADAIFLYCFLRQEKPKKIVEIGSGYSSAVILDTLDLFFPDQTEVTLIEPYPDRLMSLLKEHDKEKIQIITTQVQDAPPDIFTALGSGDLLFIDSSHVVKYGSDVMYLLFEILPHLPAGIFVHFHDVFYPFEYPQSWVNEGRYWNEDYFLRAFLAYNNQWSIYFFNTYVALTFGDFIKENMPLCLKNPGGSLYIQRGAK